MKRGNWYKLCDYLKSNAGKLIKASTVIDDVKDNNFKTNTILCYLSILCHTEYIRIYNDNGNTKIGILNKDFPLYNEVKAEYKSKNISSKHLRFKSGGKSLKTK